MKSKENLKPFAYAVDIGNCVIGILLLFYVLMGDYALELGGYALSAWLVIAVGLSLMVGSHCLRIKYLPNALYRKPTAEELADWKKIKAVDVSKLEEFKSPSLDNVWIFGFFGVLLFLGAMAVVGMMSNGVDKREGVAKKELEQLQAKQCVLEQPHKLAFSKYRVKPVYIKQEREDSFIKNEKIQYVNDRISVKAYDRKVEKINKNYGLITYTCQNGEKIKSKFRYRDLMTNVKI